MPSVKALCDSGADVNVKRNDGRTALMLADNVNCAKALIAARADVNAKSNDGKTALALATLHGNTPCVKALIPAGAK